MRNLKEILKDLKITLDVKNNPRFTKRVYAYACKTPEEQSKFNLVADIIVSSSLPFDKLEAGEIKVGQRTEWFIFELLDVVLLKNYKPVLNDEKAFYFRKYLNKEMTLKEIKKALLVNK